MKSHSGRRVGDGRRVGEMTTTNVFAVGELYQLRQKLSHANVRVKHGSEEAKWEQQNHTKVPNQPWRSCLRCLGNPAIFSPPRGH